MGLGDFFGIGSVVDAISSAWQADKQADMADHAMDFNRDQRIATQDFQREMRSTQYQTAVADMAAAGLNPMLAYHQGGAGTPSGGSASGGVMGSVSKPDAAAHLVTSAQIANIEADTKKKEAEEKETIARTPTHAQSIAESQQRIRESGERVASMSASRARDLSSAAKNDAEAFKIRFELEHKLPSEIGKLEAEIKAIEAQTKFTNAQEKETQQRIKANMPEVMRRLNSLKADLEEFKKPGAEAISEAKRTTFFGNFAALVKILTGRD